MKEPFYPPRVIFDIDGTLANNSHRQHLIASSQVKADWPAFYEAADKDTPIQSVVSLLRMCWGLGYRVTICTGRPEEYRELTVTWLKHHIIPHHDLFMKADGDNRVDHEVKREILYRDILDWADGFGDNKVVRVPGHELPRHNIVFVVDDRQQVVDMWRTEGLTCLQCAKGDF